MNQEPPASAFKPFAIALLLSTVVNASGIFTLTEWGASYSRMATKPKAKEMLIQLGAPSKRQSFIDTPPEAKPPERETDFISDKDSRVDSSKQGEDTGLLPESEKKDLLPQAQRHGPLAPDSQAILLERKMQQAKIKEEAKKARAAKKMQQEVLQSGTSKSEKGLQDKNQKGLENGETKENEGKKIFENELLPTPQENPSEVTLTGSRPSRAIDDLFPLPIISIGDHTKSESGKDSFDAKGSGYGKYIKDMRDKIGIHFYKMVFFHYRTNYIFGSRAKAEFTIEPVGSLKDLKVKLVTGDPLFAEYCETVIRNAEPFAPLHKGLAPYLEDGALKIDFLFGYDVKSEDKKKKD